MLQQSEWCRLANKQEQVQYAWQWQLGQGGVEVSAQGMPHLVHQVLMEQDKGSSGKPSLSLLLSVLLEGHGDVCRCVARDFLLGDRIADVRRL